MTTVARRGWRPGSTQTSRGCSTVHPLIEHDDVRRTDARAAVHIGMRLRWGECAYELRSRCETECRAVIASVAVVADEVVIVVDGDNPFVAKSEIGQQSREVGFRELIDLLKFGTGRDRELHWHAPSW